jgi:hypothetical protein
MTTRPGYVWDSAVLEWVEIGQSAVVAPVAYQASAPSTPSTGDIWIDSDDEVPSVDSTLYYRWTKTMSGGETSLSGTDNNSLSLRYTPGYESVFINGVLQARNLDYTATSGSTIAGLTALVANDIVMVESIVAYSVGDTYTQTASDAKYVNKNVGGLNLIVPSSVSVGSGTGTVSANGLVTFTGAIGIGINNCFSSLYQNYRMILNITSMPTAASIRARFRTNGTDDATAAYNWASSYYLTSASFQSTRTTSANEASIGYGLGQDRQQASIEIYSPNLTTTNTAASYSGSHGAGDINWNGSFGHNSTTAFDGINIFTSNGGVITGTIRIYGYNNGA